MPEEVSFPNDVIIDVTVDVISGGSTPTGTKNITANGTYNVASYASAAVNVPQDHTVEDDLVTGELSGNYVNERVTSVKAYAFVANASMTGISLPLVDDAISNYTFSNCTALVNVNLPLVKRIGQYAFRSCTSIEHISLPKLTNIYTNAFYDCSSLEWLSFDDITEVPTLGNTNAFSGCSALTAIYVPDTLVNSVKTASNWSTYASLIKPLSQKPTT